MTSFEQMLLEKGYIKYILNSKTMKYEQVESHNISSMTNLDHRYFHNSDTNVLQKIANEEIFKAMFDKSIVIRLNLD